MEDQPKGKKKKDPQQFLMLRYSLLLKNKKKKVDFKIKFKIFCITRKNTDNPI